MSRQAKIQVVWLFVAVVALGSVVVLAFVKNQARQPHIAADATLEDIAKSAETWEPAFSTWMGKPAPDFSVQDTTGSKHELSDYRGRNLLVVFWATWCPACNLEIPHLVQLRNTIPEEALGILAISNEEVEHLKPFAEAKGMNYAVASLSGTTLPPPFGQVSAIPTTFFIDRSGTIKFTALGLVPLEEAKAILQAKL
ncbi:MAG TPA: TlpA disulfide reductase family protein [Sedimentisphaerales bacterium]|nr:TlpA disulfide reductase family protein [Sedimentisphaerales bacterium]